MFFTKIAQQIFRRRQREIALYATQTEPLQRAQLRSLLSLAQATEYGRRYHFDALDDYQAFAEAVPVTTYEELKGDIDRMRHGEKDVLWHGQVRWFAKSSGTTNDKSKFIPVSVEGLTNLHYKGSKDTVALYLAEHPASKVFEGKSLILGGSHTPNYNVANSLVGDLSAILVENVNPLFRTISAAKKDTLLLKDFEIKRDRLAHELLGRNVTSISGVPSWMLSVLLHTLHVSGKTTIDEVFPNLEVFFHGGISFAPYRSQYEQIIHNPRMTYVETYNASEGFFGIQNTQADPALLLMIDYGVFYEFCPVEDINDDGQVSSTATIVPLHKVETHKNYALIISTNCGLWRYLIGDTVKFTSINPYKFIITGRTRSFINAFGEELIVDNAERGLALACQETHAEIREYTAAPVFMGDDGKCRHQWLIEFAKLPADLHAFAQRLDHHLQQINSDYEAKRFKDITLQPLEVIVARKNLFSDWLRMRGKLGGQHKVPRLANNRQIIEKLLEMNT